LCDAVSTLNDITHGAALAIQIFNKALDQPHVITKDKENKSLLKINGIYYNIFWSTPGRGVDHPPYLAPRLKED